jgi:hypothetical protein
VNRPRGRSFSAGNQCGKGRPKGSRNNLTLEAQKLLEKYSESLVGKCIAEAMDGNMHALRMCLERLLPVRRDNPFRLKLAQTKTIWDVAEAIETVVRAVAEGRLSPAAGEAIVRMLEIQRNAIETRELEARIAELESNRKKDDL